MEAKKHTPIKLKEFFPQYILPESMLPNIKNPYLIGDLVKVSYSGAVWKIIRFTEYYGFVDKVYCLIPNAIMERDDVKNGAVMSHPIYQLERVK